MVSFDLGGGKKPQPAMRRRHPNAANVVRKKVAFSPPSSAADGGNGLSGGGPIAPASDRLGELETGAVFEAVESGFDEGVRRVRTKDGWASVLSAKGTPLLQRCPAPGTEAPLPRCATPDGIGCF